MSTNALVSHKPS